MTTNVPVFELPPAATRAEPEQPGAAARVVDVDLRLDAVTPRLAIRAPGDSLGRAEAVVGKHNWAAKHQWTEGEPPEQVTVFEFDEPLPPGAVRLRIPVLVIE